MGSSPILRSSEIWTTTIFKIPHQHKNKKSPQFPERIFLRAKYGTRTHDPRYHKMRIQNPKKTYNSMISMDLSFRYFLEKCIKTLFLTI